MENTEINSEIIDEEITKTDDSIPLKLIKVDEGSEPVFYYFKSHFNSEITPQNQNIANFLNQSTSATQAISNSCAETRTIKNRYDDDELLLNSSESEDEEYDYFDSSLDSSEDESFSDEDLHNNDFGSLSKECKSEPATLLRVELNKSRNLLVSPPQTPYEAFRWFLSDDLLDTIVRETNAFGKRHTNSSYKELTRSELLTFLGLLLHTGTVRMNWLDDYWRSGYLFNSTEFSGFMAHNRFLKIFQTLSFAQQETGHLTDDIVANFRPIIDHFNTKMKQIYYPGKQLILVKTPLSCSRQIFPKVITERVFFLMLTDSNGVVMKYQVVTKKDRVKKDQHILGLIEDLDQGHIIYMDKCFGSYKLADKLLKRTTYCTARLGKKEKKKPLPEGAPDIHVIKHCSRNRKYFLTTECGSEFVYSLDRKGEFQAVINYRKYMYVTSKKLLDTLSSHHPYYRNTVRAHERQFVLALQICLNNAFQLFNLNNNETLSFSEFRMSVLHSLLPDMSGSAVSDVHQRHKLMVITRTRLRLQRGHMVQEGRRRRCVRCHRSCRYECTACPACPAFCPPCYSLAHPYYN